MPSNPDFRPLSSLRCLGFLAAVVMMAALPNKSFSWPGFDWDIWQKESQATRLDLKTPQAGKAELLPLLMGGEDGSSAITTVRQWEEKRAGIFHTLSTLLGTPSRLCADPPSVEVLGEEDLPDHIRRHLKISGESQDPIFAYLLLPKPLPAQPSPAVIVLHQTQSPGKQEAVGMVGDPGMAFGVELARRGFVILAYDAIGFGERIPPGTEPYTGAQDFFRKHPKWSFFGKMIWDFRHIMDFMETVPQVNPERIGVIGHSHGAYGAIFCSLFEQRIKATVASCGVTTLRGDPNPERWSRLTALLPAFGFYLDDISQAPIDCHEIVACLAPRPFFNFSTLDDEIFPHTENLPDVFKQVSDVYSLYGARDRLQSPIIPGPHRFPVEYRNKAYDWLASILNEGS